MATYKARAPSPLLWQEKQPFPRYQAGTSLFRKPIAFRSAFCEVSGGVRVAHPAANTMTTNVQMYDGMRRWAADQSLSSSREQFVDWCARRKDGMRPARM